MTTSTYLASLGVTMQQARDFVLTHYRDHPQLVLDTARQYGITNEMLGEIADGYSAQQVREFFAFHGMNAQMLDPEPLLTEDVLHFSSVVGLNPFDSGVLATASLREQVMAQTGSQAYLAAFDPNRYEGGLDGVFTTSELGIAALGDLAATSENLQSLFYGTIIRVAYAIDAIEAQQLKDFVAANWEAFDANEAVVQQFLALLGSVVSDPGAPPFLDDGQIAAVAVGSGRALVTLMTHDPASLFDELLTGFL